MWTRGQLKEGKAREVLVRLSAEGVTGTLTVQGADDVLAIRFRSGEVVGADALRESFEEGLGRLLVEAGLLGEEQVQEVASVELSGTMVDHLLQTGMVEAPALAACLRDHSYRLLLSLLAWTTGEYQFYEGEVARNRAVQPLSVEELLVRASEVAPELTGGVIRDFDSQTLRPSLEGRSPRVISWDEAAEEQDEPWISPLEDTLLKTLDGLTPSAEFQELLGIDSFRLRHSLDRLARLGLVEPVAEAEPAAASDSFAGFGEELGEVPAAATTDQPSYAEWQGAASAGSREDSRALLGDLSRGFSWVLAAGTALLLLGAVLLGTSSLPLEQPFPWQRAERERVEAVRTELSLLTIANRLGIHHILFGEFPRDLATERGVLLPGGGAVDPRGRLVSMNETDGGVVLELEEGDGIAGAERYRFELEGNFLLDPDFTRVTVPEGGEPVVLVD